MAGGRIQWSLSQSFKLIGVDISFFNRRRIKISVAGECDPHTIFLEAKDTQFKQEFFKYLHWWRNAETVEGIAAANLYKNFTSMIQERR